MLPTPPIEKKKMLQGRASGGGEFHKTLESQKTLEIM